MLRLVLFALFITAIALVGAWVASNPGDVVLTWLGWRAETSVGVLIAMFVIATLTSYALLALFISLFRLPGRYRRRKLQRRHMQALQSVTYALTAFAIRDASGAALHSKKIHKLLGDAPIAHLLNAQVARMQGNALGLERALEAMQKHPETKAIAAYNMARERMRHGELSQALMLVNDARMQDPKNTHTLKAFVSIAMQSGQWVEAASALEEAEHKRALSRAELKHLRGLALLEQARSEYKKAAFATALTLSTKAHAYLKHFVPANALHAEILQANGKHNAAIALLKKAWAKEPHPLLTQALFITLQEAPVEEWLKTCQKVGYRQPDHPETRLLIAEACVKSKEWFQARAELINVLEQQKTPRACLLMAAVERGEYNDETSASNWEKQAAGSREEAGWHCRDCGHVSTIEWHAHCPNCASFDSYYWGHAEMAAGLPVLFER